MHCHWCAVQVGRAAAAHPGVATEVGAAGVGQLAQNRVRPGPVQDLPDQLHADPVVQRLCRALHCNRHALVLESSTQDCLFQPLHCCSWYPSMRFGCMPVNMLTCSWLKQSETQATTLTFE